MELVNKTYKGIEEYIFHFDHHLGRWLLIASNIQGLSLGLCLADFLALKRIQLPDDCRYCYYTTDCAEIKFRESGAYIHLFYSLIHEQNP